MAATVGEGEGVKLPIPKDFMWPVLEELQTRDEAVLVSEITERVASRKGLSEAARNRLHKDGPKTVLQYRIEGALARLMNVEAVDLLENGYHTATEAGRAIETEPELRECYSRFLNAWYLTRFGDKQVWLMAAGEKGTLWDTFVDDGIATVGWADIGDLREYDSRKAILHALTATGKFAKKPTMIAKGLDDFANYMQVGDTIIARKGLDTILGEGRVIGEYSYDASRPDHRHSRRVNWAPHIPPLAIERKGITTKTLTRFTGMKDWLYDLFGSVYTLDDALKELFVDETSFRRIRDTLKLRKNLILQGPPGTGKTFMARRLAWCLIGFKDSHSIEMVQFHQSYAYEDFVQGYRPTEHGGFSVRNGVFYDFCARARADQGTPYVFIIDEINRGNMSRIFGELLMLIEADKRSKQYAASLTYGKPGERFFVPPNVHILGMMNTADRSLAVVDYALRRRFAFEDLKPAFDNSKFRKHLSENKVDATTVDLIQERMQKLNEKICDDAELGQGFEIGHSYFVPGSHEEISRRSYKWYEEIVDTQIAPLLREYWFDNLDVAKHEIQKLKVRD